ncbi:expressed unknown protein [Seminavis robusta]|uniref:Peptidase M12A domain-containing protein n=1 Tax=Seminavis robusta TaxID=568900 RepID=A0A9N8H420_9STRA|nr:expressed unknown protein [Seminavis robusta]|eukprot:Sro39_g024200.1 n/a (321) ;mRNA; r:92021-92983
MMFAGCLLAVLISSIFLLGSMLRSRSNQIGFGLRSRNLGGGDKNQTDVFKGDITVDFYRTYQERQLLGISWKDFSISKSCIRRQIDQLDVLYQGRINFHLGSIYEVDDAYYHTPRVCFDYRDHFLNSDHINDLFRVSVLVVREMGTPNLGCAFVDAPLGGKISDSGERVAPILVMSAATTYVPAFLSNLGIPFFGGYLVSHEMGHVLGFAHTATQPEFIPNGLVYSYTSCGSAGQVRYPVFSIQVPEGAKDGVIWDGVTGDRYDYEEWKGRTNNMASFNTYQVFQPWKVSLFRDAYSSSFDDIIVCWFEQSAQNAVGVRP